MSIRHRHLWSIPILAAGLALPASTYGQTTYNWVTNANSTWSTVANWSPVSGPGTTIPNGIGDVAQFGNFISANRTVTIDNAFTVGGVTFTNPQFSYTLNASSALTTLTLNNGTAGAATITMNSTAVANQLLQAPIVVADVDGLTITNNSTQLLSIATTGAANNINTGGNAFSLAGPGNITLGAGTVNQSLISSSNLNVGGTGVMTLAGNNTAFTGKVVVGSGSTFALGSTTAINAISGTDAITLNGGTLQFGAAVNVTAGQGITLGASGGTIQGGSSPTIVGVISGSGNLVKLGTNTPNLQGNNTYLGSTLIADGSLTLGGANGALSGTSSIQAQGVFFTLDNTATVVNTNRINDTASIQTQGATINLRNLNTSAAVNEVVGNYSSPGLTRLRLTTTTSQDVTLTAGNLTVGSSTNFLFTGTNLEKQPIVGTASIFFNNGAALEAQRVGGGGAAGSTTISILPWAFATSAGNTTASVEVATAQTLATYTIGGGVRALNTAEYTNTPTTTNDNLRVVAGTPVAINAPTTVNAMVVTSFADLTGTDTLTLRSGTLLTTPTTAGTITPNLSFVDGATNRTANLFNNGELTLPGTLSTTAGLNKSGSGGLILSGNNSATLTGTITVHEGNFLRLTNPNAVNAASPIHFDGPGSTAVLQLVFPDNNTYVFANPIRVANTDSTSLSTGTTTGATALNTVIRLTGVISTDPNIPVSQVTDLTLTGDTATKSNTFRFENAGNTFRGDIRVANAVLELVNTTALGHASNSVELLAGSATVGGLRFGVDGLDLNRGVIVSNTTRVDTNGFTGTFSGPVSGASILTKVGAGTLVLSNTGNTHTGTINVEAGTLQIDGVIRRSANDINVNGSSILAGAGTINRQVDITASATIAPTGVLSIDGPLSILGTYAFTPGDLLQIGSLGSMTLGAASILNTSGLDGTSTYTIANLVAGNVNGTFLTVNAPGYDVIYGGSFIQLAPAAVPEPATLALIGTVGVGVYYWRRRTLAKKKTQPANKRGR